MQQTKLYEAAPLSAETLQMELLARAAAMHEYVERRIPRRWRADVAPEDVLQEVRIGAFAKLSSYRADSPDALDRWLRGIMNHKLVDAFKRAAALKRGGGGRAARSLPGRRIPLRGILGALASQRTPSGECRRREALRAVEEALGRLPVDEQTAVRLRYVEDQPREEIARRMQKSVAAVNSLLFRGLQDIRRCLGDVGQYLSSIEGRIEPA